VEGKIKRTGELIPILINEIYTCPQQRHFKLNRIQNRIHSILKIPKKLDLPWHYCTIKKEEPD
jgi:hypothetical protein